MDWDKHYKCIDGVDTVSFDNVIDMYNAAEAEPQEGSYAAEGGYCSTQNRELDSFQGVKNWAEAVQLRKDGWPEGLRKAEALASKITGIVAGQMPVQEIMYAVSGNYVDIGRYLEGDPECFGYLEDTENLINAPMGKIVRIGVNVAVSAAVDKFTIERRGAAILAVTKLLELVGRSVTVDTIWASSDSGGGKTTNVVKTHVKKSGENLSPESLAFAIAHPAYLRMFQFRFQELMPTAMAEQHGVGYKGYPSEYSSKEYDIFLPHNLSSDFQGDDSIVAWVKKTLAEQGIEMEV